MKKLGYGLAFGAMLTATSAGAQTADGFRDSWFWGAKAGVVSIGTQDSPSEARPTFGGEWLITRTRGGLYISADYTNVEILGSVEDPTTITGRRAVEFRNLRRIGFAGLVFPRAFGTLRPYGGIGLSINVIARARPVPDVQGGTVEFAVENRADEARSRSVFQGMLGAQAQFGRLTPFAQLTLMPSTDRWALADKSLQFLEFGVRYNVGTSRDRTSRGR